MRSLYPKTYIFFAFLFLHILVNAQNLPIPSLVKLSYNLPGNQLILSWQVTDIDKIDGFIIYRTVFNFQGIADSAFMPVAQINNPFATDWNTDAENGSFGFPALDSTQYVFKVASFKNNKGVTEYSELSEAGAPPFLFVPQLIECGEKLSFRWKQSLNQTILSGVLILETKNYKDSISLQNNTDKLVFSIPTEILNSQLKIRYQEQTIDSNIRVSNIRSINLLVSQEIDLYIDSLVAENDKAAVYFDFKDINKQVRQISILENGVLMDTIALSENKFTITPLNNSTLYTIRALNACKRTITQTANFKVLSLINKTSDTKKNIEFLPIFYYSDSVEIQRFTTYEFSGSLWEKNQEFSYIPNSIVENISSETVEKKYRADVWFIDLKTGKQVYFRSDILKISKEAILKIPNAIFLYAPEENDRYFSVLARYISDFEITIYSENGTKLYNSQNISFKWQPENSARGISRKMYFYRIEYRTTNGKKTRKEGKFITFF